LLPLKAFKSRSLPFAEQHRIVERIDALFAEIAEGEAALAEARKGLDLFRRSLLKPAVTGELTRDWREANKPAETAAEFLANVRKEKLDRGSTNRIMRPVAIARVPENGALPKVPDTWLWADLGSLMIAGTTNGYSPKKSTDGCGTLALKLTATTQGQIDLSDHAVKALSETIKPGADLFLRQGDLLFQRGVIQLTMSEFLPFMKVRKISMFIQT
jgi:type I restriction enzyme S subunit